MVLILKIMRHVGGQDLKPEEWSDLPYCKAQVAIFENSKMPWRTRFRTFVYRPLLYIYIYIPSKTGIVPCYILKIPTRLPEIKIGLSLERVILLP